MYDFIFYYDSWCWEYRPSRSHPQQIRAINQHEKLLSDRDIAQQWYTKTTISNRWALSQRG
jgi:hypothetical protein